MSSKAGNKNLNKKDKAASKLTSKDEELIKKRLLKVLQKSNIEKSKAGKNDKKSKKQINEKITLNHKVTFDEPREPQKLGKGVEKSETIKNTNSKKPKNKNLQMLNTNKKNVKINKITDNSGFEINNDFAKSHNKEDNNKTTIKAKNPVANKVKSQTKHELKLKKREVDRIAKVSSIETNSKTVKTAQKSKSSKKADVNLVKSRGPVISTEAWANEAFTEEKKKVTKRKSGDTKNKTPPKKKKITTIPELPENKKKKAFRKPPFKKQVSNTNVPVSEDDNPEGLNGLESVDTTMAIDGSSDSDCNSWETESLDISNHIERTSPYFKNQTLSDSCDETEAFSQSLVRLTSNKLGSSPESVECDENTIDSYDSDLTQSASENFVFSSDYEDDTYSPSYSSYSSSISESDSNDYSDYLEDYNSADDESYHLPEGEVEDVIIPKGAAIMYDFNDDMDLFDNDASSAQIVEIQSSENCSKNGNDNDDTNESDDSCVKLIPIEESNDRNEYSFVENDYGDSDSSAEIIEDDESNDKSNSSCDNYDSEDSCIQLVPIEDNTDDELVEYMSDESESIEVIPHIFEATNESERDGKLLLKDILQNGTYETESISNESINDVEENPYTGLFNMSDNNMSKSEVITISKTKLINELNYDEENLTTIDKSFQRKPCLSQYQNGFKQVSDSDKAPVNYPDQEQEEAATEYVEICTEEQSDSNDYRPSRFYNAITSKHVLLLLKDFIYIYGTLKARLIAGGAEIYGFNLERNNTFEIFSPRGYSSLYFKPVPKDTISKELIKQELSNFEADFLRQDLEEILELFEENNDAILLLERNDRNKKVDMIKKYMNENLFPNMNSITLDRPFYASEFILRCLLYSDINNFIKIKEEWNNIHISQNSKILIIGGKGVGKSTLGRYLINRNLSKFNKFLLIDLDIGQPELFVPQTISATLVNKPILGPGYFVDSTPGKSFLFGDLNVVLSPVCYANNVKELTNYCYSNPDFKNIPWIINTMGYNKGFGSELVSLIVHLLKPTEIIQIQSYTQRNNFDYIMTPANIKSIPMNIFSEEMSKIEYEPQHHLTVVSSSVQSKFKTNTWEMMPKDTRLAMLLSHLGTILGPKNEWLTDVRPVCAPIDELDIINSGEDNLQKEDLLDVINGNLVYLCRTTIGIECYGIGIVRAIDHYQRKIFLLPAVESHILANINALAVCSIPLPASIYTNQGPKIKDIVPYVYNTNAHVASRPINQYLSRL